MLFWGCLLILCLHQTRQNVRKLNERLHFAYKKLRKLQSKMHLNTRGTTTSRSETLVYYILEMLSLCVMFGSGESIKLLTDGRTSQSPADIPVYVVKRENSKSKKTRTLHRNSLLPFFCLPLETRSSAAINLLRIQTRRSLHHMVMTNSI